MGSGVATQVPAWPPVLLFRVASRVQQVVGSRYARCGDGGPTYIPGEMGIRHEDIIFITENGAENMTKWTGAPEEPAVV
jgi:Xaa-Pro aminopeptidase